MSLKILGAILVIIGCGSFGFLISASDKKEENNLRQLCVVLEYMECELLHRLTPLPQLCRQAVTHCNGYVRSIFLNLGLQLESHNHPDVQSCMEDILVKTKGSTLITYSVLQKLGNSLGRFDLEGQVKGIQSVGEECNIHLKKLLRNQEVRLRSYKTLGLCAGAALAILFV